MLLDDPIRERIFISIPPHSSPSYHSHDSRNRIPRFFVNWKWIRDQIHLNYTWRMIIRIDEPIDSSSESHLAILTRSAIPSESENGVGPEFCEKVSSNGSWNLAIDMSSKTSPIFFYNHEMKYAIITYKFFHLRRKQYILISIVITMSI